MYIRSEEVTFVQEIRPTDLVMVEADRGYDIGQVVHTTQDRAEAERVAIRHWEKFLHNLLSFSMMYNPNAAPSQPAPLELKTHSSRIKRHAPRFEYINLVRKEHSESKAKRTCQEKASEHQLNMEILDVEFQSYAISFLVCCLVSHRLMLVQGRSKTDRLLFRPAVRGVQRPRAGSIQDIQGQNLDAIRDGPLHWTLSEQLKLGLMRDSQ